MEGDPPRHLNPLKLLSVKKPVTSEGVAGEPSLVTVMATARSVLALTI